MQGYTSLFFFFPCLMLIANVILFSRVSIFSFYQIYLGLRSRVGVANYIDDGFSWTILRCSHDHRKVCSPKKAALIADCNTKLAIGLNLMEECFRPMVDPRTGIDMIPHVLYNFRSVSVFGGLFSVLNFF